MMKIVLCDDNNIHYEKGLKQFKEGRKAENSF